MCPWEIDAEIDKLNCGLIEKVCREILKDQFNCLVLRLTFDGPEVFYLTYRQEYRDTEKWRVGCK